MDIVSSSSYSTDFLKGILFPVLQYAAVQENLLLAQNSLLSLLFLKSLTNDEVHNISDFILIDKRFPVGELKRVEKPADENKDAGDSEDDDDDDDDDKEEDDDDSGEEGSDDDDNEGDSDGEVNGNEEDSDDDDDDDDDEDNDDDDDDEDDDEDDEEDEEEETQPPSKKKK